jgi:ADP-ribose pyrophosphatase YjhB (NUDIX family)
MRRRDAPTRCAAAMRPRDVPPRCVAAMRRRVARRCVVAMRPRDASRYSVATRWISSTLPFRRDQPSAMSTDYDLVTLLDAVQTIARNGLAYAESPYDRERYERLLELCEERYAPLLDVSADLVRTRLRAELGYITPKVGASAAVVDDDDRILVARRADDGTWCLPGGWSDPNESPAETATREAREEIGVIVEPLRLVDVFMRRANAGHGPHSAVSIVYLCRIVSGEPGTSHEVVESGFRRFDEIPAWHELHEQYARAAIVRAREIRGRGR